MIISDGNKHQCKSEPQVRGGGDEQDIEIKKIEGTIGQNIKGLVGGKNTKSYQGNVNGKSRHICTLKSVAS